ncbi:MAG: hypothetical protein RLZ98_1985 [Pseudomonadota bacterium]|jgi:alkylation response protein AidB-like acyl-CoA dehydrogenase
MARKPGREELIERAREVAKLARREADRAERERKVSSEVFAAAREAQFFRLLQPERFGGFEYDFGIIVRIALEVGQGCASSAWVLDLAMMHQWLVANFPLAAQEDVWGSEADAVAFGSYSPACAAMPVDGGWRISGCWPFASGCDHGQWALLGARFETADNKGPPAIGFVLVPNTDYSIKDDWFTNALAGTGSKSITCNDVFVPAHRRLMLEDAKAGRSPGAHDLDRPLYRLAMFSVIPTAIAGPALGALKGALGDYVDMASARKTIAMGSGNAMAGFAAVQSRVAEAAGTLDAATLMILRDVAEAHAVVESGAEVPIDMRVRNRLTHGFILKLAVQGIDALYGATGATGFNSGNRIERAWRDIHAISHHISLNWDAASTLYGKHRLGLDLHGQY